MSWDTVQQFIRIAFGWAAGYLVVHGYLDQANADLLVGGAIIIAQVGWWYYWNRVVRPLPPPTPV